MSHFFKQKKARGSVWSNPSWRTFSVGLMLFALGGFCLMDGNSASEAQVPRNLAALHIVTPIHAPLSAPSHALNPHLHFARTIVVPGTSVTVGPAPPTTATKSPSAVPATPGVAAATQHAQHKTHIHQLIVAHTHYGWHRTWSYHTFAAHHRGTGVIQGYVRDGSGRPIAGARVVLKTPKGRYFKDVARRHVTHTNANGAFVMRGVRAGGYRVVARKEKGHGHVQLAVHTGSMATAAIKI